MRVVSIFKLNTLPILWNGRIFIGRILSDEIFCPPSCKKRYQKEEYLKRKGKETESQCLIILKSYFLNPVSHTEEVLRSVFTGPMTAHIDNPVNWFLAKELSLLVYYQEQRVCWRMIYYFLLKWSRNTAIIRIFSTLKYDFWNCFWELFHVSQIEFESVSSMN